MKYNLIMDNVDYTIDVFDYFFKYFYRGVKYVIESIVYLEGPSRDEVLLNQFHYRIGAIDR